MTTVAIQHLLLFFPFVFSDVGKGVSFKEGFFFFFVDWATALEDVQWPNTLLENLTTLLQPQKVQFFCSCCKKGVGGYQPKLKFGICYYWRERDSPEAKC